MHHGIEFTAVFLVCVVLVAGAALRAIARRVRVPYTVAMLLLGLATGLIVSNLPGDDPVTAAARLLLAGQVVSDDLIMFVFLPALVFESAHSLDQHAVRKEGVAIATLAVPALLASTVLTALAMVGLTWGAWDWSWRTGLVFGALISATDPVAVVAILREVGAPKRLSVLIEGESLLNDGTAIVVFNVLLALLVASGMSTLDLGAAALDFAVVVAGGAAVGLALGYAATRWMARTFNDPLVEITLTLSVAYLGMVVAEGFLHVSGVIAIVVAGMWLGGRGKTAVSPEVADHLHRFWEVLAHLANTIIFFLVGLIVSRELGTAGLRDLLVVAGAYASVMVVRAAIVYGVRPALAAVGGPDNTISRAEAAIISWSGLRGAVSLALALLVRQHPDVPDALGHQILLATAGVVLLTIAINGATASAVMRRLGLTAKPAGVRLSRLAAHATALSRVWEQLRALASSRELRALDWSRTIGELEDRRERIAGEVRAVEGELRAAGECERLVGFWQRALAMERDAYWDEFGRGTLSADALRALTVELDRHGDRLAHGTAAPPPPRSHPDQHARPVIARALARLVRLVFRRRAAPARALELAWVTLLYELARAEASAALAMLARLDAFGEIEPEVLATVRDTYRSWRRQAVRRVEEMRINSPEVSSAVESRLAARTGLNLEREMYHELVADGTLDAAEGEHAIAEVEQRMHALAVARPRIEVVSVAELCRATPLFAALDDDTRRAIADRITERVFAPGDVLVRQGERGTSAFVIARGAAEVLPDSDGDGDGDGKDDVIDVLGTGEVFGEIALLTDAPRTATVRAATTLTVGEISRDALSALMARSPELGEQIWDAYARHQLDNFAARHPRLLHMSRDDRAAWIADRHARSLDRGDRVPTDGAAYVFVVSGALIAREDGEDGEDAHEDARDRDDAEIAAPALVPATEGLFAAEPARVLLLPHARGVDLQHPRGWGARDADH